MALSFTKRSAISVSRHVSLHDLETTVNIPHHGAWDFPLSKAEKIKRMLFVLNAEAGFYGQELDSLAATYEELQSQLSASRSVVDTYNGTAKSENFNIVQTSPKSTCPETCGTTDMCSYLKQAAGTATPCCETSLGSALPIDTYGYVECHIVLDSALTSPESACCELGRHRANPIPSLPCIESVERGQDISALLGQVREWIRHMQRESGDLANAWHAIDAEHKDAIHGFLTTERMKRSIYRRWAKYLLTKLQLPSTEELDPAATVPAVPIIGYYSWDLPNIEELNRPTDRTEVFQKVRAWVRSTRKQRGDIGAWSSLHSEHQRAVHGFLIHESQTGSMRSKQAQEILAMLPPMEEDAAQLVAADGDVEDLFVGFPFKELERGETSEYVDTFDACRQWVLQHSVVDLAVAGSSLPASIRQNVVRLLQWAQQQKFIARDVLDRLRACVEWTVDDVSDMGIGSVSVKGKTGRTSKASRHRRSPQLIRPRSRLSKGRASQGSPLQAWNLAETSLEWAFEESMCEDTGKAGLHQVSCQSKRLHLRCPSKRSTSRAWNSENTPPLMSGSLRLRQYRHTQNGEGDSSQIHDRKGMHMNSSREREPMPMLQTIQRSS